MDDANNPLTNNGTSTRNVPPNDPSQAALIGEPGTLPPTWCKKCQATVVPEKKGMCPRCQGFLRQNFVARKHPVNVLRKQQILAKLVADYHPSTTMQRATCENLAGTLEQLEALRPGSPEWQRLTQISQQLGATLEESRVSREPNPATNYSAMTDDQLIERTTEILRHLLTARDLRHAPCRPDDDDGGLLPDGAVHDVPLAPVAGSPVQATPTPEPICPYCRRPCVGPDHSAYSVLHWSDPEQVKRRSQEATAVMMKQGGKPLPEWYQP